MEKGDKFVKKSIDKAADIWWRKLLVGLEVIIFTEGPRKPHGVLSRLHRPGG